MTSVVGIGTRVSYEDMANPLREGAIVGEVAGQWAILWDAPEAPSCDECGSTDLCFGVDESDVEDGTYVCEDCDHRGGRELLQHDGLRFHTTVTKHMLASAVERQERYRAEGRGGRCGGWNVDAPATTPNEKGLAATRAQDSKKLAESFRLTDDLLSQPGVDPEQRQTVAVARGWILEVLQERGELALVGMDDEYRSLDVGSRVRIVSEKSRLNGTLATVVASDPEQWIVQPDGEAESPVCVWKTDRVVVLEAVENPPCIACGAYEPEHDEGCVLTPEIP